MNLFSRQCEILRANSYFMGVPLSLVGLMEVTQFKEKSLESYGPIIGEDAVERIREKAEELRSLKVAHVNSTAFGGGVAEILYSMVPLMKDAGLDAQWYVIEGEEDFFRVTKTFHNALQGDMRLRLTKEMCELYLETNRKNASKLNLDHDIVVIHDPQPAPLIAFYERRGEWVWRCHIDLSTPNPMFWDFLKNFIKKYKKYIFHMEEYVQPGLEKEKVVVMPPSIDPLSDKNKDIRWDDVVSVLNRFDVDPERPIIAQVGRFDPWKGVFDVIEIYRKIKQEIKGAQLLLIASMAHDDPEGWVYYEKVLRRVGEDYDVHILTNLVGVHAKEVNAFQRASTLVFQMSTREGFGLAVTEAMWKGKPVIGRGVGGIKLQIIDGFNGFLVNDVNDAVEKALLLIKDKRLREDMGKKAKEHVKQNFLITKHLERYLDLFSSLIAF